MRILALLANGVTVLILVGDFNITFNNAQQLHQQRTITTASYFSLHDMDQLAPQHMPLG